MWYRMGSCVLGLFLAGLVSTPASADVVAKVQDVTLVQTGNTINSFFDVFLEVTNVPNPPQLAAFNITIDLVGPSGVSFQNVLNTSLPEHDPVFAITPLAHGLTATHVLVDNFVSQGSEPVVADGMGLFRVNFSIPGSTAPGTWQVNIDLTGENSVLSDPDYSPIPFRADNGSITLTGAAAVPLPSAALSGLAGLLLLPLVRVIRARRRRS